MLAPPWEVACRPVVRVFNTGERIHLDIEGTKLFCSYGRTLKSPALEVYPSSAQGTAGRIVERVLDEVSNAEELQGKHLQIALYRDPGIRNAAATILPQGDRVILFDGIWTGALRQRFSKWANRGVFAHEVGHHYHWDESQNHVRTIFTSSVEHLVKDNPEWLQELFNNR